MNSTISLKSSLNCVLIRGSILCVSLIFGFRNELAGQLLTDSVGVFIPRDEHSSAKGPQKYMWVDLKNVVISTLMGTAEFIEVWTDNGRADRPKYYSPDFCTVTPAFEGPVVVYTSQRIPRGTGWDTIYTADKFMAINQPEIRVMDLYDSLTTTGKLEFFLADKYKFQALGERYVIAKPYSILVFDESNKLLDEIENVKSTIIDLKKYPALSALKKGYRIAFQLLVRDRETDLLIPADEWVHIVD